MPAFSPQHHAGRLWSRSVLSGPVERRSGQTVQLRRPGHLDSDRRSPHRCWLRGTCWRFPLHMRRPSGRRAWVVPPSSALRCFPLWYLRCCVLITFARLSSVHNASSSHLRGKKSFLHSSFGVFVHTTTLSQPSMLGICTGSYTGVGEASSNVCAGTGNGHADV